MFVVTFSNGKKLNVTDLQFSSLDRLHALWKIAGYWNIKDQKTGEVKSYPYTSVSYIEMEN